MVINRVEIMRVVETIHQAAQEVMEAEGIEVPYKVGVMIETPAAVRTADTFTGDLARYHLLGRVLVVEAHKGGRGLASRPPKVVASRRRYRIATP